MFFHIAGIHSHSCNVTYHRPLVYSTQTPQQIPYLGAELQRFLRTRNSNVDHIDIISPLLELEKEPGCICPLFPDREGRKIIADEHVIPFHALGRVHSAEDDIGCGSWMVPTQQQTQCSGKQPTECSVLVTSNECNAPAFVHTIMSNHWALLYTCPKPKRNMLARRPSATQNEIAGVIYTQIITLANV